MRRQVRGAGTIDFKYTYRQIRSFIGRPRIVQQLTPVVIQEADHCQNPIFLIGVHRSGTTLARRLLNSHSQIACPPETYFLAHYCRMISDNQTFDGLAGMGFTKESALEQIRISASRFHEAFRTAAAKPRWADKTPQYTQFLPELAQLFGKRARFVLIYRDPFDVAASLIHRKWNIAPDTGNLTDDICKYVRRQLENMQCFEKSHESVCISIRYEALATDPKRQMSNVLFFLEEEWQEEILQYWTKEHNFGTEDPQVRGMKEFRLSAGNWKRLDRPTIDVLVSKLGETRKILSYADGNA